jgi:oligosaccharide repeat unit polymerase
LTYLKSRDFPIHLLCYWWAFWLLVSQSSLNVFRPPSPATMLQYALLIASFLAGHLTIRHLSKVMPMRQELIPPVFRGDTARMKWLLAVSAVGSGLLLLISLKLSGAYSTTFVEYFLRLRVESDTVQELTGNHSLDVLTKVVAFPLSYTIILVILANEARYFKWVLIVCICNLLAYSYLWQVNYPLIHLFWILAFYLLLVNSRKSHFNIKTLLVVSTLFALLLISAANRFGGDVLGGFQRYIVGYHLLGFSFYDYQYNDPHSILHLYSYGRSSLGFLDQTLQAASKLVGENYNAASFENSAYNNQGVDVGRSDIGTYNAFGTILFSLYRDFDLVGIWLGGFVYGAAVTQSLYRSAANWIAGALFLCLASSWMIGMMVSPLEQAYFWFAIVVMGLIGLINRGLKW